jgi:NTP pyrophosphatase (non-canonical NTP hydrolase)
VQSHRIVDIEQMSARADEVSRLYAQRFGIDRDASWYLLKLQEELGELVQSYLRMTGNARTDGAPEVERREQFTGELADVLCHVLLLARFHDVDLSRAVEAKWFRWLDREVT